MNFDERKSHYGKCGMYNGYDKNNKEREALDYYATPPEQVYNILKELNIDFTNCSILEPCAGGGHMIQGICSYLEDKNIQQFNLIVTDIQKREKIIDFLIKAGKEYDFLSDSYPIQNIDYIIMNPPFSVIEPFVMKSLSIANKGIIMLGRLQFLEGQKRYEKILKDFPPSEVYIYYDRISCYKNGKKILSGGVQAYAWFYWNLTSEKKQPIIKWISREGENK